ncbi:MAG TPA: M24 family metallopeptidase, partial [Mycobacteriales bacterium]|nr:M24 family metallopeptidase [Mycobacteriales bacterium]
DVVGWAVDRLDRLPRGPRVGFDVAPPGERDLSAEIEALRRSLTPAEVDRYRSLGSATAEVFTQALSGVEKAMSERQVAAALGAGLLEIGADPIVLLVAGAARVGRFRHPLPTAAPVGDLAMVVACARRGGLIAALTRYVSFGGLLPSMADAYERLLAVERVFLAGTTPGAAVGAVWRDGSAAYASHGFPADESDRHHQGGPIGYFARDYIANATSTATVAAAQAFAWNPSVPSLKVEDTVLTGEAGIEVLTVDPDWPSVRVGDISRPSVLSR